MAMGDDSCLKGRGFESLHRILDGHLDIFFLICCKIVLFLYKTENNRKRGQGWPFFKKSQSFLQLTETE